MDIDDKAPMGTNLIWTNFPKIKNKVINEKVGHRIEDILISKALISKSILQKTDFI